MSALSRREFGRIVIAGVPLAAIGARTVAAESALLVGVTTDSFRDLPRVEGRDNLDDVIRAVQSARATRIDLALANLEPAPPMTAPVMGGSAAYPRLVILTPQQIAATNATARAALRRWRLGADVGVFAEARRKLAAAGITANTCTVSYDRSLTDDEIDATFRQVKALGAATISSAMTMETAARIAPFAERHQVTVAIHNQVDGNAAGDIATANLKDALALSPAYRLKLDVGHLTASNCDAVAELRGHLGRVSQVVLKDRLRNGGPSQVFGEGDTPIKAVLALLRTTAASIPVFVEYDYIGLRTSVDEVKASLAYVERAAG